MISVERLLKHMAWANQKVYSAAETLPDEAFGAYIVNPEWTVARILEHIVGGATWYVNRLEIEKWKEIPTPKSGADVKVLKTMLADFDAKILSAVEHGEGKITGKYDGKDITRERSTIISQAVHHATEHRAQLIDALEFRGYKVINLDDIDLWSFESAVG
ncbi:MAG: hypothetical protein EBZ66_03450 [Actinobacteria bacterium]|nr:hypothetical protein [Actinomycetota bacterium]